MPVSLVKYFTVYLLSTLKFIGGPASGLVFGMNWPETALLTIAGMMTSVVVFSMLGKKAKQWISHRFGKKEKLFTRANRRKVNIWRKYGLAGVAFLTPVFLTPIGGTLLASSFGESKGRIWGYMFVSAVFWGVVFSFAMTRFGKFW
ncbi:MAG: hypothetical protein H7Z75_01020 [Ferruginibacter sp.]|nr:hypothetical protein [Cytophagales bacterium]